MHRVYLFVIGLCICCPLLRATGFPALSVDPTPAVTLDMRNVPLQDILLEIEKQTGIFFSYESSMLKEYQKVSLTVHEESLSYCLKRLFDPLPLVYRVTGQYVILKQKPRLYTISGFIRDSASYESLISATVIERVSGKGSVSNNYGFYSITLPPGKVELSSSYVGYERYTVTFELTKDTLVDLPLKAAGTLGEVVVQGILPRSDVLNSRVGVVDIPVSRVKSLPALLGEADVVKTLQRLPGTTVGTEGMSGLFVRGGDGDDNLYLLDGNPIYHTNHVLGFFSAFNPDAVKNTTFYKGSFPAEYGGRLSSVIDVRTNEGNRKEYHGNVSIGLLAARANLEGPIIKDRSSFNVSVRRTWMELITWPLMKAVPSSSDTDLKGGYHFYDMNAKVDYSFSDKSRAYLSFYMGSDSYRNGEDSKDIHGEDRDFRWRWGNLIGSAGWNYVINKKLFATFTGGYTRYRSHIIQKQNTFMAFHDRGDQVYFQEGHYRSAMEDVSLRASFDYRPNADHRIRMGGDYLFHIFRPEQSNMSSWYKDSVITQKNNTVFSHSLIHGHEVSAYAEDEMTLTDRLRVNAGLRLTLFHVQGETYQSLQPRFSARYLLGRRVSVKASYTKMNQYIHLLSNSYISQPTDIWVPVTGQIRPMSAHQVTGGLFWHYKGFDFSAEGYYKRMNNLVEYKDNSLVVPAFSGWEDRVGVGKGRSYGLELMAQKKTGRFNGWIGYTLSWSDRWFPDGSVNKGVRFPSKYDNRHKIDIVASYKLSRKVELTAAWMYKSGNHVTIQDMYYRSSPDYTENGYRQEFWWYGGTGEGTSASSRNNYQLSPYHRLDLGANFYRYKKNGRMGIWNLSLCNAYFKPNPFSVRPRFYTTENGREAVLEQTLLFLFVPSLSYTYKF
ncbi:TonB-dependent receptor [Parabacteroides sp. AF17-28]|uniref:TonB-dependent receptor n=3 Tax=Parabacteroides TaxID=375288 RepID=UPI000EFF2C25|nr:TonB-dependent receptor [Parabacteroides sp. AF17-28]RHR49991.1 hypothetical protein DWW90_19215 [Parabacteroides sp. AF17-28]